MTQENESFWSKFFGAKKSSCCCSVQIEPEPEEQTADENAAEEETAKKTPMDKAGKSPCCGGSKTPPC